MHEALFYEKLADNKVHCTLCPRDCVINDGKRGFCYIRKNEGGVLYAVSYGKPSSVAIDPIEKKPLFHFLPGSAVLSIGTVGCNLGCKFCQNWDISKARDELRLSYQVSPEHVVFLAKEHSCLSIGFTYNDPTIFAEYCMDTFTAAQQKRIKRVFVTAGYITPEAREAVYSHLDAANIDLKSFSEKFYKNISLAHLEPVLDTIKYVHAQGIWCELTTLLIPGRNDSGQEIEKMCDWILAQLGPDVPLHFTAFHPDYLMMDVPPTPPATVEHARNIALGKGLHYVYTGNIHSKEGQNTYCPSCNKLLIERSWHHVIRNNLVEGTCPCGRTIPGVWN